MPWCTDWLRQERRQRAQHQPHLVVGPGHRREHQPGSADDDLTDSTSEDIEFYESNNLADYPILQQHTAQLSEDVYGDEFEDALEDLINRIEHGRG